MKIRHVYHPLMFPFYYVLFLFAYNVTEASVWDLPLPFGLVLGLSILLWGGLWLLLRDVRKAGILATLMLFLFVSYGHVYLAAQGVDIAGFQLYRHRYLLPVWAILLSAAGYLVIRVRDELEGMNRFLNMTLGVLICLSLFNIALGQIRSWSLTKQNWAGLSTDTTSQTNPPNLPDIYYIILDGYGSERTLNEIYGFDNSSFLNTLRNRNFFIASNSFSNYAHTPASLASTLNMRYVNFVAERSGEDAKHHTIPFKMIRDNEVVRFLKARGYKYILLRSGFAATDRSPQADVSIKCGHYNEFIKVLIHTTMLIVVEKHLIFLDWHRENVARLLELLETEVNSIAGPKFVFAHVLIPHAPYLFGAQGEPIDSDNTLLGQNLWLPRQGYIDQMTWLNGRVISILNGLQAEEGSEPIIIIQGDHGPGSLDEWSNPSDKFLLERMTILNAYRLPDGGDSLLYDGISPVNSFRVILNRYFDANLELLEDRSWFSPVTTAYKYTEVTDRLRELELEVENTAPDTSLVSGD